MHSWVLLVQISKAVDKCSKKINIEMDVAMNETGSIANIADQIYKRFHFEQGIQSDSCWSRKFQWNLTKIQFHQIQCYLTCRWWVHRCPPLWFWRFILYQWKFWDHRWWKIAKLLIPSNGFECITSHKSSLTSCCSVLWVLFICHKKFLPSWVELNKCPSLFVQAMKEVFLTNNTLTCLRNDRTSAMLTYFFYLNKLSDLTETYFFLVKKSWRQISYLHVYHHIMVISCIYADIYLQPGATNSHKFCSNS